MAHCFKVLKQYLKVIPILDHDVNTRSLPEKWNIEALMKEPLNYAA